MTIIDRSRNREGIVVCRRPNETADDVCGRTPLVSENGQTTRDSRGTFAP